MTAAITLLAACGGGSSSRLSKPEYVRRAEAICRQANKKVAAVPVPDQRPTTQEKAIGAFAEIQRAAVADLQRLPRPEADQATLGKWLGLVDQAVDQLQAAGAALKAGNGAAVTRANAKGQELSDQADKIARAYGLDQCSATESP